MSNYRGDCTKTNLTQRIGNLIHLAKYVGPYFIPNSDRRWAFLFITRKCNLNCPYCNAAKAGSKKDIDLTKWKAIIDRLVSFNVRTINISGGEPLLRQDIYDIIAYIRQSNVLPFMHSNFSFVKKKHIDLLSERGLFALYASIDSFGILGKVYKSDILDLMKYASDKGIVAVVSAVVTSKNINDVYELAKIVTDQNLLFCPGLYQPVGGVYSQRKDDLIPDSASLAVFSRRMIELKNKTGRITPSYSFFDNIDKYPDNWKCNSEIDSWLVVNNDGTLMPCQEYASNVSILDINTLNDSRWRKTKKRIVSSCRGCYHHCHFQQEDLKGLELLKEWRFAKYLIRRAKL